MACVLDAAASLLLNQSNRSLGFSIRSSDKNIVCESSCIAAKGTFTGHLVAAVDRQTDATEHP
eukprot:scaffold590745_cov59-Attheya_sp.AAC.2